MDGHPALVAQVDELHRLLLREVRVGDDHLLHALAGEDVGQVTELPSERRPLSGRGVSDM